jgi:hypothetical protein
MKICVHIDELVLHGLPVTSLQGPRIQRAVETELRHLLFSKGLAQEFQTSGSRPSVRADTFSVTPSSTPAQLGKQIARSVYRGIGKAK